MASPRLPILPHGSPSALIGLSETFSFHSSPEAFITSRVLAVRESNPDLADSRTPIRAKVLNRNVAVISSYEHVKQILCRPELGESFGAAQAYDELMAPFFPPSNLLLSNSPFHGPMKETWEERMQGLPGKRREFMQSCVYSHFQSIRSGSTVDLYESMKKLSWKILLGVFLSSSDEHDVTEAELVKIESLQEVLLRGQFSLFPVSINTRFWQSPRAKGLEARKKLQELLKARLRSGEAKCPFAINDEVAKTDVASHLLLFTSSLAVKASASILTAFLLNLYVAPRSDSDDGTSLAGRLRSIENDEDRNMMLYSTLLETERLSPPVVGIMRRSLKEVILTSPQPDTMDTIIPKAWDVWMYFVGAARDPAIFGSTAEKFLPTRYYNSSSNDGEKKGFAFGNGPKACLGAGMMREIAMTVAKSCIGILPAGSEPNMRLDIQADAGSIPRGVQGWLGWQTNVSPEDWVRDMKQLPTQRPIKAVNVVIKHDIRWNLS